VVKALAKLSVEKDSGIGLMIDSDIDEKCRYSMVVSEFVRGLGCYVSRAIAALKLDRLHLVDRNKERALRKAAGTVLDLSARGRARPSDRPSWYISNYRDEEAYGAWASFRSHRFM